MNLCRSWRSELTCIKATGRIGGAATRPLAKPPKTGVGSSLVSRIALIRTEVQSEDGGGTDWYRLREWRAVCHDATGDRAGGSTSIIGVIVPGTVQRGPHRLPFNRVRKRNAATHAGTPVGLNAGIARWRSCPMPCASHDCSPKHAARRSGAASGKPWRPRGLATQFFQAHRAQL